MLASMPTDTAKSRYRTRFSMLAEPVLVRKETDGDD
jgi:hypothetical protein